MIGRNGHLRWRKRFARAGILAQIASVPPLQSAAPAYEEITGLDCSGDSFEGIRSRIFALLLEHFHFEFFFAFANIVSPFVERSFGVNFDPSVPWDRNFIDAVMTATSRRSPRPGFTHPPPGVLEPTAACLQSPIRCLRKIACAARPRLHGQRRRNGNRSSVPVGAWPHTDRSEARDCVPAPARGSVRIDEETAGYSNEPGGAETDVATGVGRQTVRALQRGS